MLASLALVTAIAPVAATGAAALDQGVEAPGGLTPLYAGPSTGRSTAVGASATPRAARAATVRVTYSGFPDRAKAAVQAAVNIWAARLSSRVPIRVQASWTNLGTGVLAAAGPTTIHRSFRGSRPGTWYPVAIANRIAGTDVNGSRAEIVAYFNSQYPNWYFGTSGPTPANKYDLETVALHELGHGLGFTVSFRQRSGQIVHGTQGRPWIEDVFATDSSGRRADRFPSGSTAFENAVTGNNLFWNGPYGKRANRGRRPKLYAPGPWQQGSSASHLDESTYRRGNANSLMTPRLGQGERILRPGPITIGILQDSGWAAPK